MPAHSILHLPLILKAFVTLVGIPVLAYWRSFGWDSSTAHSAFILLGCVGTSVRRLLVRVTCVAWALMLAFLGDVWVLHMRARSKQLSHSPNQRIAQTSRAAYGFIGSSTNITFDNL